VTCLWLLPFCESPLRDDGYDVAHYERIHPDYGTCDDFVRFLDAAHGRGLRVITELVVTAGCFQALRGRRHVSAVALSTSAFVPASIERGAMLMGGGG